LQNNLKTQTTLKCGNIILQTKILTIIQQGRFKELLIIPAPTQNQGQCEPCAKEHYFEGSHNLEESSDFEGIGQGSLDYASSEGVGQGSLDYTSSEGKPGFQGSPV